MARIITSKSTIKDCTYNLNIFKENLQHLLNDNNLNQSDFGREIGISKQTVNKYLQGEVFPSIETLIVISKVFDCSLDYLFDIK